MLLTALDRKFLRDVSRLKGQVLTIALVLACGIASFIGLQGTCVSLLRSRDAYYDRQRFAHVFAALERPPETITARLEALLGVASVQTRISKQVSRPLEGMPRPASGRLLSLPPVGEPATNAIHLRSGRLPERDRDDEVVLLEPFAEAHGLRPGHRIPAAINGKLRSLRVVGAAAAVRLRRRHPARRAAVEQAPHRGARAPRDARRDDAGDLPRRRRVPRQRGARPARHPPASGDRDVKAVGYGNGAVRAHYAGLVAVVLLPAAGLGIPGAARVERRPVRTLLSSLGIAGALALLVLGRFALDSVEAYLEGMLRREQRQDLAVTFARPVSPRAVRELAAMPGVRRVEGLRAISARVRHEHPARDIVLVGLPDDATLRRLLARGGRRSALLGARPLQRVLEQDLSGCPRSS